MTVQSWVFGTLGTLTILLIFLCWIIDFRHKRNRTLKHIVTAGSVSMLLAVYAAVAFGIAFQ